MTRNKDRDVTPSLDRPSKALLIEVKSEKATEDGQIASAETETFAALSLEEVIAYVRRRQPNSEIMELKVLDKIQVLSSSEHLN